VKTPIFVLEYLITGRTKPTCRICRAVLQLISVTSDTKTTYTAQHNFTQCTGSSRKYFQNFFLKVLVAYNCSDVGNAGIV